MREILFRAKRLDNGEWIEGSFVAWHDGSASIDTGKTDGPMYAVDPATVVQYTGLTDKNGVKIFEGDIVQDMSVYLVHLRYEKDGVESKEQADKYKHYGVTSAVRYSIDGDVGSCGCCYTEFTGAGFIADHVDLTQCQVIGNIHDNPELMEGG